MLPFKTQLQHVLDDIGDPKLPADVETATTQSYFWQRRRFNPVVPWSKYLSDPENAKCLTSLAGEFLRGCKLQENMNEPLGYIFQQYGSNLQSPSRSALLLGLLYNIFHPPSTLSNYERIKSSIVLSRSFLQLVQYLDISNQLQWVGTTNLILRCLQQPDSETIPPETSVPIISSILKKINQLPLNCSKEEFECATLGLEVVHAFLHSPTNGKPTHATYYDLMKELPQTFPIGVVVHWTLESFIQQVHMRTQNLASLIMPPNAAWPLISQISRQHEFTNLAQRPGYLMFSNYYATAAKEGHITTVASQFGDLLFQRAPSDEIFFKIRQLPQIPSSASTLRESLVIKTRNVVKCIQRHSRFHEPRPVDTTQPVPANPDMVIPDNIDFMELLIELSDHLYAFVGTELSQISNIFPTGYSVLYEDLIADYKALVTGNDKNPAELEKDNTLIYLLLQLIHIEKVGGKDKLLPTDYAGDERLFSMLISLYNEDQVNSKDGFYLRDLSLQCAISHQQSYIRDRTMMKYRHPKLSIIWPYYSQICYNIQSYFLHKYKNNIHDTTTLSNLSMQENIKIAMESQLRQHIVAGTLFIYLVPTYQGKEPELDPSGMFLNGGALSYKLLDLLNIDTKHRLLGLIYKMMLDSDQGPRFHGDPAPVAKFLSPYVVDVIYKLLSNSPCAVELVMKTMFEKLRRYDRMLMVAGAQEVPKEITRWQHTVLQLLTFRMMRPLKYTATCAHLLHYIKFALASTKHRAVYSVVETFAHGALSVQTSHKFMRSLIDNKRERPYWFEESEVLARRAVLTVARIVKLRGQGDAPLGIISEVLQYLLKHPILWSDEVLAFFPEPVRDFYSKQTVASTAVPGSITEDEVSNLLDRTYVHNVLLVPKGTEPNTYLLSHYSNMENHPYFLCVFWEIIVIHQQISETMLDDVRAVLMQFPPANMSMYTQQLVDYALRKVEPEVDTMGSVDFVVRMFEELVWKYHLLSIEHVLLALITGHPSRNNRLGLRVMIQMTVHSVELSNRISHWMSIGVSPRPWEEDRYYDKMRQYLEKYPEYFGFEAYQYQQDLAGLSNNGNGNGGLQPPLEMPLLVFYSNVLLRLLNTFDVVIGRLIEYQCADELVSFLDKFGCMYAYHNTPMAFVRDTLLYYNESPLLQHPSVMKGLVRLLDFKQVELHPVLTDYAQEVSSPTAEVAAFDELYVHDVLRKLATAMDPRECGYKTDPQLPERHYREIPNPTTLGLYTAVIEILASPIPKENVVRWVLDLALANRISDNHGNNSGSSMRGGYSPYPSFSTPTTAATQRQQQQHQRSCRSAPDPLVLHAAGFLFSVLPKSYVDVLFQEFDRFVRTDELLLEASTHVEMVTGPTAKGSSGGAGGGGGHGVHGAFTNGFVSGSTTKTNGSSSNGHVQPPSLSGHPFVRTAWQDRLLGTFFSDYVHNRNNFGSNRPNSFLTLFHSVCHYSSADVLLRVVSLLEGWRNSALEARAAAKVGGGGDDVDAGTTQSMMEGVVQTANEASLPPIKTDVQLLFVCALVGPLLHRFEKVQIGGTTGHFLVVLVELLAAVTTGKLCELAAAAAAASTTTSGGEGGEGGGESGLETFDRIVDFLHHVRSQIPKDPDTTARLALAMAGMSPWLRGRIASIA
ncbi:Mediator of RNA polymerase II transcription subunit 23 [Actinomortierella ambigua]|nr:Mediator of RNA polymerase II transcription subunit 23 [Actinomortierella ambigua]